MPKASYLQNIIKNRIQVSNKERLVGERGGKPKKCSLVTGFGESWETHKPGTTMLLVLQCLH